MTQAETEQTQPEVQPVALEPIRIAIVGFTASHRKAPWGVEGWNIWACNNLPRIIPDQWHRLYDLHTLDEIAAYPEIDREFLTGSAVDRLDGEGKVALNGRPLYTLYPQEGWPTAVEFPQREITAAFDDYYTNSISWMVSHALLEMAAAADTFADGKLAELEAIAQDRAYHEMVEPGLRAALRSEYLSQCELHIYGVDMSTGTEYSAQRPSVEWHLGIARGMGVKLHVPIESDLLKTVGMYGTLNTAPFAAKLEERRRELTERGQQIQAFDDKRDQERKAEQIQIAEQRGQIRGALETVNYFSDVWLHPSANRDGSKKDQAADGSTEAEAAATNGHGDPAAAANAIAEVA